MKCLKLAVLIAIAWSALWGQGLQNAITGEVKDQSGAVLPNVSITVINTATNVRRPAKTDATGHYTVPSLVVGEYTVRAELAGMKTAIRQGVVVQADNTVRADITMGVGELAQSVEVTAEATAALLRTEDAATGMTVSERQGQALPLKGRNFASLAQMVPGANEAQVSNQNSLNRTQPLNLSVNGQRQFDNNYRMDGVSMIAGFVNGSTFVPSLESLKEVSVQTGQYSAAMGLYSGAQVDMVVKSGGNQVHGSLFEFFRNNKLNARQFFDVTSPPPFRYNQFGATVGGPMLLPKLYNGKDRTFFFFGFEGSRTRRQSTGLANVATAAMRQGDFSAVAGRVIRDPFTKQPFPGNVIPRDRLAPQAQKLLAYVPLPNTSQRGFNYINTGSNASDENQYFGRLDHRFSDRDTLFFRSALRDAEFRNVTINPNFGSLGFPANQNHVLSETHIFSPRVFNEAQISYIRETVPTQTGREGADIDPERDFGMRGLNFTDPLVRGIPNASISGYLGTGENFANPRLLYYSPAVRDNVMVQLSKHTIRFGGELFLRRQDFYAVNARHQGSYSFTGLLSGDAFADFILGLPNSTTRSDYSEKAQLRQWHGALYVNDDWRATRSLTLNLGVRFEHAGVYRDQLGNCRNFDWRTMQQFPEPGVTAPLNESSNDIAPRVGFAWRVRGSNTVVRGGFGLFYTQPTMANVALLFRNPPRNRTNTWNTNLDRPNLTLENGFPQGGEAGAAPVDDLITIPVDYGPGYAQSYSFNIQHSFGGAWVVEAGYIGSHTLGLDNAWTANTPPPGAGAVQPRRPYQQWGNIRVFATDGMAYYNGLQTRLQTRQWRGLNLLNSYTLSKCMDTNSQPATSSVGTEDAEPQNQNDRFRGERGRCAIDLRHQFKLHAVYELPFGAGWKGFAAAVVKGWQLSGGLTLHAGSPFTAVVSGNRANTSRGAIRPNRVADGNLPADRRTPDRWFDTAAFVSAPLYTFGSSGRNIIEGPATKLLDLSLLKRFRLGEAQAVEFRADFFNLSNTPQFNTPGRTVEAADFGRISSVRAAREIQFGLRLVY
jgi:hypothetical protein